MLWVLLVLFFHRARACCGCCWCCSSTELEHAVGVASGSSTELEHAVGVASVVLPQS